MDNATFTRKLTTKAAREVAEAARGAGLSSKALCAAANIPERAWRNTLRGSGGQFVSEEHLDAAREAVRLAGEMAAPRADTQPTESAP